MKTITSTFLLFLFAVSASATSITWSGNGANAKLFGLTSGSTLSVGPSSETASLTVYYLLYSDYDAIKDLGKVEASELESFIQASVKGQTSTSTGASGRFAGTTTAVTTFTEAGVSFFARAYGTFEGKTYFMDVFGGSSADGTWTLSTPGDASAQEKFSWVNSTDYGGKTSTSVGAKNAWVAVPEPSTAALALAGLALLLKRRKA